MAVLRVGLTGGIASGKTRVLRRFAAAGFRTVDLDRVAHEIMSPGQGAYAEVVAEFGRAILAEDGTIDRRILGPLVFADPEARARLDAIVHPHVRTAEARLMGEAGPEAVAVTDAALLVESGMHLRFDRLVVVHCGPERQVARLMARDGLDEAAARARIGAQMPAEDKRCFAHHDIDSEGDLEETDAGADRVAGQLAALARRPSPPSMSREQAAAAIARGRSDGPRGLLVSGLLLDMAAAGGLDLARSAARCRPPVTGPWYAAEPADDARWPGPQPLAVVSAISASVHARGDAEVAAAAAHSLAWLVRARRDQAADMVAAAVLMDAAGRARAVPSPAGLDWHQAASAARKWGGGEPSSLVAEAARAAAHASDPASAGAAAAARGGDAALAGSLFAAATARGVSSPDVQSALAALLAGGR